MEYMSDLNGRNVSILNGYYFRVNQEQRASFFRPPQFPDKRQPMSWRNLPRTRPIFANTDKFEFRAVKPPHPSITLNHYTLPVQDVVRRKRNPQLTPAQKTSTPTTPSPKVRFSIPGNFNPQLTPADSNPRLSPQRQPHWAPPLSRRSVSQFFPRSS